MDHTHDIAAHARSRTDRGRLGADHAEAARPPHGARITRFDLLRMLRQCRARFGLSPVQLDLLTVYIEHTSDIDYRPGNLCVCWRSVATLCADTGHGRRTLQRIETTLETGGFIKRASRRDGARDGFRDPQTGRIKWAWGVDLSPLINPAEEIIAAAQDEAERRRLRKEAYANLSGLRARIDELLPPFTLAEHEEADAIICGRACEDWTLEDVMRRADRAAALLQRLETALASQDFLSKTVDYRSRRTEKSDASDTSDRHNNTTINKKPSATRNPPVDEKFPEAGNAASAASLPSSAAHAARADAEKPEAGAGRHRHEARSDHPLPPNAPRPASLMRDRMTAGLSAQRPSSAALPRPERAATTAHAASASPYAETGADYVPLDLALAAASPRFAEIYQLVPSQGWRGLVETAAQMLRAMGVHPSAWEDAVAVMGQNAAALAVILAERRATDSPGGYLRELTARARNGSLRLHKSFFAISSSWKSRRGKGF